VRNMTALIRITSEAERRHEPIRLIYQCDVDRHGKIFEEWQVYLIKRNKIITARESAEALLPLLRQAFSTIEAADTHD
jgi:hypothetical protein